MKLNHFPNKNLKIQKLVNRRKYIKGSDNRFTKGLPVPANQPYLSYLPVEEHWLIRKNAKH